MSQSRIYRVTYRLGRHNTARRNLQGAIRPALWIGLLWVTAIGSLSACSDDSSPTESPGAVSSTNAPTSPPTTPTTVPTVAPVPATNIPFPTPQTAPASNIPFPSPTPSPTPDSAIAIMAAAREEMGDVGSAAFDISANLEALSKGRTEYTPVTYVGDFRTSGYNTAHVTVTTAEETFESRVITLVTPTLVTTHVRNASTGGWDTGYGYSAYFVDTQALFGGRTRDLTDLELTGQKEIDGVETHEISGKLKNLRIAGARGDFDVVFWIGADDGLVREVFAFGQLDLKYDTALIGGTKAETASIKLTGKLFDHGKPIDVVTPTFGQPRFGHDALLLDDWRVLVGGGFTGIANNNVVVPLPVGLVQIFDPATGLWTHLDPVEGPGVLYSAVKLMDGRVLFIGLEGAGEQAEGAVSVFDPAANSWRKLPAPPSPRAFPEIFLLEDRRVLVVGGLDFGGSTSARAVEILDLEIGLWRQAASMTRSFEDQPIFLWNDGKIVALGTVRDGDDLTAHVEMYDPSTDVWTIVGSAESYYVLTGALVLTDGRILVIGELADQVKMASGRNWWNVQVELPDGRRLTAGEFTEQFSPARIYDPAADTWLPTGEMFYSRATASVVLLA